LKGRPFSAGITSGRHCINMDNLLIFFRRASNPRLLSGNLREILLFKGLPLQGEGIYEKKN